MSLQPAPKRADEVDDLDEFDDDLTEPLADPGELDPGTRRVLLRLLRGPYLRAEEHSHLWLDGIAPYRLELEYKLRGEGWQPTVTGEQAYVEGTEARWWSHITPKRRQELSLGALVVLLAAVVGGGAAFAVRAWRRRPR